MTRLLTCGYETGDVAELGTSNGTGGVAAVASTPTPRAGSYCLKIGGSAGAWSNTYKMLTLPASKTDVWLRCAIFVHGFTSESLVLGAHDSASGAQTCVTYTSTDGLLRVRSNVTVVGTLLGTASTSFAQDTWHVIDWRIQITSATVGIIEVWLDGSRVINATSVDNTNTTTLNVQSFSLGCASASTLPANSYIGYDDIGINDTAGTANSGRLGDGRVVLLVPNGAGSNTNLTRGGTDSGNNWDQVNDVPPSMTDYVFHATVATRDTYALADLPVTPASVNCCEVIALVQNSDAGGGSLGLTVKSGSTTNEGTAIALGTTAAYIRQLYETDPATSTAWTASGVNALEAGVTVR